MGSCPCGCVDTDGCGCEWNQAHTETACPLGCDHGVITLDELDDEGERTGDQYQELCPECADSSAGYPSSTPATGQEGQ